MENKQGKKDKNLTDKGRVIIDGIVNSVKEDEMPTYDTYMSGRPMLRKLLTGILMLSISVYFIFMFNGGGREGVEYIQNFLQKVLFASFLPTGLADFIGSIASLVFDVVIILFFVRGIYRIGTCNMHLETFENKRALKFSLESALDALADRNSVPGGASLSNIESLISYRESKMCTLTSEQGAELLVRTAALDAAKNGLYQGRNTQSAASYLNSKLGTLTVEGGINYVTGKK